jgi:hypothetical protein
VTKPAVSRRVLLRRLGLAGSVALLLPVVTSINAPAAAQAASPPPTTGTTSRIPCGQQSSYDACTSCCDDEYTECIRTGGSAAACSVARTGCYNRTCGPLIGT